MGNFKGFDQNAFMLLEMNKFNDSKDFYESVKDDIKRTAIMPMRQLAGDLGKELIRIDDKMNLIPTKMVSRIRRDTRFSKNKDLYRANVWCMFMRDKHQWQYQPCMWFEFYPNCYSYGVGMFRTDAAYLECFRETLKENQALFKKALKVLQITGAELNIECFKKDKPGIEEIDNDLKIYYNCRNFGFICYNADMNKLIDGSIKEELIYAIRAFAPMYQFLIKVTEKMYEKGE